MQTIKKAFLGTGLVLCLLAGGCSKIEKGNPTDRATPPPSPVSTEAASPPAQETPQLPQIKSYEIECADGYTASIHKEIVTAIPGVDVSYSISMTQGKDNTTYRIDVLRIPTVETIISVFDESGCELQTIEEDIYIFDPVEFIDINWDGYADLQLSFGGTMNEVHKIYVWDADSCQFVEVNCDETLFYLTAVDGLVKSFAKGGAALASIQYFAWENFNTLTLISTEKINLEE